MDHLPRSALYFVGTSITFTGISYGIYSVAIFAVSANCGTSEQFGFLDNFPVKQPCSVECSCGPNGTCVDGFCQQCSTANDCPDHLSCVAGMCVPCSSTCGCPDGTQCFDGECLECRMDSDCKNGLLCRQGKCLNCLFNEDCGPNQFCINNICVQCEQNSDCTDPSLPFCAPATGTCSQCLTDQNCAANEQCFNGSCVCSCPAPQKCFGNNICANCIVDSDCQAGQHCYLNNCVQCVNNVDCVLTPGTPVCSPNNTCVQCDIDADCSNPARPHCNPGTNTCVNCVSNSDCIADFHCVNSVCTCDLTPPTITLAQGVISNVSDTASFSASYTAAQVIAGTQQVFTISVPSGPLLFTSAPAPSTGSFTFNQTPSLRLYPSTQYTLAVQLILPCGTTAFSAPFTFVMPGSSSWTSPFPTITGTSGSVSTNQFSTSTGALPSIGSLPPAITILISHTPNFHPNTAAQIYTNPSPANYSCNFITCTGPGFYSQTFPPVTPVFNATWSVLFYIQAQAGQGVSNLSNYSNFTVQA